MTPRRHTANDASTVSWYLLGLLIAGLSGAVVGLVAGWVMARWLG